MITDWIKTKPSDDGNHIGMRIGYRNLPKGLDKNCYEPIYMKNRNRLMLSGSILRRRMMQDLIVVFQV